MLVFICKSTRTFPNLSTATPLSFKYSMSVCVPLVTQKVVNRSIRITEGEHTDAHNACVCWKARAVVECYRSDSTFTSFESLHIYFRLEHYSFRLEELWRWIIKLWIRNGNSNTDLNLTCLIALPIFGPRTFWKGASVLPTTVTHDALPFRNDATSIPLKNLWQKLNVRK